MVYVVIVVIACIAIVAVQVQYAEKKPSKRYLIPSAVFFLSFVLFLYSQLMGEHVLITGYETNAFVRLLKISGELIVYNVLTIILFIVSVSRRK